MTPVFQTPSHREGNCLQAAVASVLDLPLNEVPDWSRHKKWFEAMVKWAKKRDLGVVQFWARPEDVLPTMHNIRVVLVGETDRNQTDKDVDHAVVALVTTVGTDVTFHYEHDPHPSKAFLDRTKYCFFFTKL